MVFDIKDQYIVVDVEELHEYLKDKELKMVYLEELISKLDWNIILLKIIQLNLIKNYNQEN